MKFHRSNDKSSLRVKQKEKQEEEEEWLNRVTNLVAGPKKPTNSFASFFSKAFVVDSNRWMNTFSKGGGGRGYKMPPGNYIIMQNVLVWWNLQGNVIVCHICAKLQQVQKPVHCLKLLRPLLFLMCFDNLWEPVSCLCWGKGGGGVESCYFFSRSISGFNHRPPPTLSTCGEPIIS